MIRYEFLLSINGANFSSAVDSVQKGVNASLAEMGHEEKLVIRLRIPAVITSGRELTEQEIELLKSTLIEQCDKSWNAKIEEFRRQSGNVQQSVS